MLMGLYVILFWLGCFLGIILLLKMMGFMFPPERGERGIYEGMMYDDGLLPIALPLAPMVFFLMILPMFALLTMLFIGLLVASRFVVLFGLPRS